MDTEDVDRTQILGLAILVVGVISVGYTYTVSQDIDSFQNQNEVQSLIEDNQEPLVNEFDSVVQELDGNISENTDMIDSVNETEEINQLENEKEDLQNQTDSLRQRLNELEEYVNTLGSLEITSSNGGTVQVENSYRNTVESVIIQMSNGNTTNSQLISEIKSGETGSVTFSQEGEYEILDYQVVE